MERKIARFTERIVFQKNTTITDKYLNHTAAWVDYFSCYTYASTYQYDKEKNGEVIREEWTINFEVRYCSELKCLDSIHFRVMFHGAVYNIISVDMMNYQNRTIRVRCKLEKAGDVNG